MQERENLPAKHNAQFGKLSVCFEKILRDGRGA